MRRTVAATVLAEVLAREGERLGVNAEGVAETIAAVTRMVSWRLHGACPTFATDFRCVPLLPAAVLEVCADRQERSAWRAICEMVRHVSPVYLGAVARVVGWFLSPSRFGPPAGPLGTPPGGRLLLGHYGAASAGGGDCRADGFGEVGGGVGGGAVVGGGGDLCGFTHSLPGDGYWYSEAGGGAKLGGGGIGGGEAASG